jgi:hypothetical protein
VVTYTVGDMVLGKVPAFSITFLKEAEDSGLCISCCSTSTGRLCNDEAGEAEEREGEDGRRSMDLDHEFETEDIHMEMLSVHAYVDAGRRIVRGEDTYLEQSHIVGQ